MNNRNALLTTCTVYIRLAGSSVNADVDLTHFDSDSMVSSPEIVACTLTTGVTTECAQFVVKYKSDTLETGPYCPDTLQDTGGIWAWDGEQAGLYRLDGIFFRMLSKLGFNFSDDGQHINIADPAAGPPSSDHACLEAAEDSSIQMTLRIPISPTIAESTTDLGTVAKVGLALDAVPIFADAPSVLQTGHLPALDTCGGHIDPGGWYHWHATATDINTVFEDNQVNAECALPQLSDALFGYAFDGYAMYGSADRDGSVPTDLDECSGHIASTAQNEDGEYHYHSTSQFPNLPACLSGVQAQFNFSTTATAGIGSRSGAGGHDGPGMPDFAQSATTLGVSEQALMRAMQNAGGPGPNMDITAVAVSLGVTAEALQQALPSPPGR